MCVKAHETFFTVGRTPKKITILHKYSPQDLLCMSNTVSYTHLVNTEKTKYMLTDSKMEEIRPPQ